MPIGRHYAPPAVFRRLLLAPTEMEVVTSAGQIWDLRSGSQRPRKSLWLN